MWSAPLETTDGHGLRGNLAIHDGAYQHEELILVVTGAATAITVGHFIAPVQCLRLTYGETYCLKLLQTLGLLRPRGPLAVI